MACGQAEQVWLQPSLLPLSPGAQCGASRECISDTLQGAERGVGL